MDHKTKSPASTTAIGGAGRLSPPILPVFRYLLLYGSAAVLPLTFIMALLLGMVFHYRIDISTNIGRSFPWEVSSRDSAYYIDFSASSLLTISSWISIVSRLMTGFIMTLCSYIIANKWYFSSLRHHNADIPTPLQFALLVKILGASLTSLYNFLQYQFRGSTKRSAPFLLKGPACVLVCTFLLGWTITAVDTWLHATSATVQLTTSKVTSGGHVEAYGKGLSAQCAADMELYFRLRAEFNSQTVSPCNVGGNTPSLPNMKQSMSTAFNISTENAISLVDDEYVILLPGASNRNIDYRTSTFALRSSCKLASKACGLESPNGQEINFDCSRGDTFPIFKGDILGEDFVDIMFANDSGGTQRMGRGTTVNPFRFAYAARFSLLSDELQKSDEIVSDINAHYDAIIICETGIYDVDYFMLNGTVANFTASLSNDTMALIASNTGNARTFWITFVEYAILQAGLERNTADMARSFANSMSRIFMSINAGIFSPRPNEEQWVRVTQLVARFPMAPFWTLIALAAVHVVFAGMVVGTAAWNALGDRKIVAGAQLRLSIEGLAASAFGGSSARAPVTEALDLFEERHDVMPARVYLLTNELGGMDMTAVEETLGTPESQLNGENM